MFETHHSPIGLALADTENELSKDLLPLGGVGDLSVELDSVNGFRLVGDGGERSGRSRSDGEETFGKSGSLVSVRHPDLQSEESRVSILGGREGGKRKAS